MEHQKLTFEDIMQSKILFYDKDSDAACLNICEQLKIDNLPAIDGTHYYELHLNKFRKFRIANKHIVYSTESIISKKMFKKFATNKHNVLFVFEGKVLRGVVHICDYNRDVVLQAIQDDILLFERRLRELLLLNGYTNKDILDYFYQKYKTAKTESDKKFYEGRLAFYNKKKTEIESLGAFQLADFSDLSSFSSSSFSHKVHEFKRYQITGVFKSGQEILRQLRNIAMHGKNPVSKDAQTSIFSLESLHSLMLSLEILREEYAAIINKIRRHPDYLKSISLENKSKLEIIHSHHPKALEYFLGWN